MYMYMLWFKKFEVGGVNNFQTNYIFISLCPRLWYCTCKAAQRKIKIKHIIVYFQTAKTCNLHLLRLYLV